ncbi:hypothetical protein A1O1_08267 [Capronia coronata CBS 617.96]|uniref:Enoyl reductase (ER) domain-containing protein n=1 Tax=Capronia coronata CBS 617.96 TaxID=1182541 RepID=W9XS09_9EURO|nr:uncharacterized protein A1O1_08267 [Capronia coronata CBS 617.96]EXJ80125.1 hypothetical protein A1O1_08267 [Capronia coronata CBS 617.96]
MVKATALVVPELNAPFEMRTVELDELRPNEVLVDLKATSICHTDLAVQAGKIPMPFPVVLGHEGAGVVRAVGSNVKDCEAGDHVILSYNFCGECRFCKEKKTYQCEKSAACNFGGSRQDGSQTILSDSTPFSTCFFGQSSFCNPAVVQETSIVKIDEKLPLPVVCALGCGFQTGAGAIYNVVKPIERKVQYLAIFGIGGVGCASVMAAHHLATTNPSTPFEIIAIDINPERLQLAKTLGATHVIDSMKEDLKSTVMTITAGRGLDAAVDCSGNMHVINGMLDLLGVGSLAVTVGSPPAGTKASVDVFDLLIGCKTYCGCHQGWAYAKEFIPSLAELYAKGQFPLESLQKTYPVQDINTACKDMLKGDVLKPVLLWE